MGRACCAQDLGTGGEMGEWESLLHAGRGGGGRGDSTKREGKRESLLHVDMRKKWGDGKSGENLLHAGLERRGGAVGEGEASCKSWGTEGGAMRDGERMSA